MEGSLGEASGGAGAASSPKPLFDHQAAEDKGFGDDSSNARAGTKQGRAVAIHSPEPEIIIDSEEEPDMMMPDNEEDDEVQFVSETGPGAKMQAV